MSLHGTSRSDGAAAEAEASITLHFATFGFVVLRRFFDPDTLAAEIDRVMQHGLVSSWDPSVGGEIRFRYVPMMSAETPVSLSMLHRLESCFGGATRRQWRLDYVRDPVDAESELQTKAYFASVYPPDWDGGHDVDRYASYDVDWRRSDRPSVARLGALGVYDLAAKQEAFARSKR